jgi:aminopeptidase N
VRTVTLDGRRVGFTHPGNLLRVSTGELAADSRHTLVVVYRGTPRAVRAPAERSDVARVGWRTTRNGSVWTMQEPWGALTWYPVNDHPSDKAFYDATIDVPARWVGVFNGTLVKRRTVDRRTVTGGTWPARRRRTSRPSPSATTSATATPGRAGCRSATGCPGRRPRGCCRPCGARPA